MASSQGLARDSPSVRRPCEGTATVTSTTGFRSAAGLMQESAAAGPLVDTFARKPVSASTRTFRSVLILRRGLVAGQQQTLPGGVAKCKRAGFSATAPSISTAAGAG